MFVKLINSHITLTKLVILLVNLSVMPLIIFRSSNVKRHFGRFRD